jgi:hypothetical protein
MIPRPEREQAGDDEREHEAAGGKQPVAGAISVELKRTVAPPHFDHFVGAGEYSGRNVEAQRPRGSAAFALGRVLVRGPRVAGARALADHIACGRRVGCIDRLRQRSEFCPGGADPFEYGQKVWGSSWNRI